MAADIFVSFASKDVRVAMTLCTALENRGFTCWISARDIDPGANFQSAIVRALRQAKIMLLVFTANSNASEEMTKELALASQNKMIVIPLRVEDVTPNDAFAYEFATRQWIDVFADWEVAIDQLSRRVGQALLDRGSARAGDAADALKTVLASANAAKLSDPEPAEEAVPAAREPLPEAEPLESQTEPPLEPSVEAAVMALEALEAAVAAEPDAAARTPPADRRHDRTPAVLGRDFVRTVDEAPQAEAPAGKAPLGLLIGGAVAVLAVVGIAIAMIAHGGSKAPPVQAPASSAAEPSSAEPSSAEPDSTAAPAALPSSTPPAASDEAQSSQEAAPAAPKPVKRKKAQPKVDIPF